jgi:hypothetical protein
MVSPSGAAKNAKRAAGSPRVGTIRIKRQPVGHRKMARGGLEIVYSDCKNSRKQIPVHFTG